MPFLLMGDKSDDDSMLLMVMMNSMTGGMSSIRGPLLGTSLRRESATEVALGLDSLRHGGKVETLNFAYLNVPEGSILGHGGSSRVYKGKYKGQDVAVKMLFCIDLTKDVVRRFFKEIKIILNLMKQNLKSRKFTKSNVTSKSYLSS